MMTLCGNLNEYLIRTLNTSLIVFQIRRFQIVVSSQSLSHFLSQLLTTGSAQFSKVCSKADMKHIFFKPDTFWWCFGYAMCNNVMWGILILVVYHAFANFCLTTFLQTGPIQGVYREWNRPPLISLTLNSIIFFASNIFFIF